ncbi:MAG: type II secretion system protein GspJ [Planctomycetota bacterium]
MKFGRRRGNLRGFSLLETLLAIGLLLALSASVYTFLFQLFDRRTRVLFEADAVGALSVVFDRLEHDLTGAVAAVHDGRAVVAGVSGTSQTLRVASRAVVDSGGADGTGRHGGDVRRAELTFDAAAGRLLGRSWALFDGGGEEGSGPEPRVIVEGVREVRFRYHDGGAWRDSFDSAGSGELPMLVEVSVWTGGVVEADEAGENGAPDGAGVGRGEDDGDAGLLFEGGPRSAALDTRSLLEEQDFGPPTRRRVFAVPDAGPGAVLVESGGRR